MTSQNFGQAGVAVILLSSEQFQNGRMFCKQSNSGIHANTTGNVNYNKKVD